jgi:hypothetical protein
MRSLLVGSRAELSTLAPEAGGDWDVEKIATGGFIGARVHAF